MATSRGVAWDGAWMAGAASRHLMFVHLLVNGRPYSSLSGRNSPSHSSSTLLEVPSIITRGATVSIGGAGSSLSRPRPATESSADMV